MNRKSKNNISENAPYRASEELYQALFEQAADGIFITDEQGHFVEVNQHGCNMLGYTREELLCVSIEDLVMAEDLTRDPLQLSAMQAGKTLLNERRLRCKNGRLLPVEISARMLIDGRFLSIVRDISKRRRVEDQLRESNERFRLLAESSLPGIYLIQDDLFRYVNPAMAQIFGYEVEELIDKLGPMDLVYSDDQSLVAENLRRRIEGEEEAIHYEFRGRRKDDSVIDVEVYGRRIEHERRAGVIGTLLDVSERKLKDEALQRRRETEMQFSERLAVLQEVTNQLSKVESSDDLYRQAVQLGRSRLGFDRVSIWFIEEHLGIMKGSFGTDEQGRLRDEREAQIKFRHEGLAWQVFSQRKSTALVEYSSLRDHLGQEVGKGDNAVAALWDGDEVIGVICVDTFFTHQPITDRRLEILRLYATTLGHLITRKRAEESLRTSEEQLQLALDAGQMGLWDWNITTGEVVWSPQCLALYGLPLDTQMSYERFLQVLYPKDRDRVDAALHHAIDEGTDYDEQKRTIWPDGSVHWTASRGRVFYDAGGEPIRITGVTFDISKWKMAEEERQTHLWFLESLDKVNRTIQGTNDLDQMMSDVLDILLSIFDCDRAWLAYPCDPEAATWQTPMERTRPEYPSVFPVGVELPLEPVGADVFRILRDANSPVQFGPSGGHPVPTVITQNFNVQSFIAMALYPKVGQPWSFGLHQCVCPRVWTPEEERLFQEIGRRLADGLTSLLVHRNLQESEERYRVLYRDNPSMFFTLDSDGVIISVNTFGASQLGYSIDELKGQSIFSVIFGEDRTAVKTQLQPCVQNPGQINRWQYRKVRQDGSLLWVEEFARTVTDPNGAINVLIVCQDITDRKQAEILRERLLAQIQKQAQQVRNIIDTVPEGVILLNKEQFVTLTNPVAKKHLSLLTPDWENGRLIHLGERPLTELLTSPPKGLWHEIMCDDVIFEAIARPVENGPENGGWVLVLRDITQERDIQRRVQQQNRLAAVGQLAAGIAHDFNNILAVVALYTELISRTTQMPPRTQEKLHTIEQQTKRAADLIQQILDFSRQSVLDRKPLDLLPFVEKLVTLLERTLPEHIQIDLDYAAEAYFIQADPTRMQQVIMNLAVNARDAMPDGGHLHIRLAYVRTEETKPITVQELPPGDWIQIEVTDTGSGIPPEALSNIFEPFFTTKKEGQGTGLGLAQVYGIIQQHEGYIDVVTEVGKGTTFFLYLPMLETNEETAGSPDRSELQMGQGQKILLVEDNPVTREAILDSLTLLNYEVVTASNGREALMILVTKADDIDLVLSDAVMPEMGGMALFHAMQEQNLTMPMVLLTGHPLNKEMENLQKLGLAGWLPKPPDLANISFLLAKVLTT